jgi:uncharacterized protein
MTWFDASAWIGRWPFAFLREFTAGALAEHLGGHGIDRALVSPLDAVFAPEPGPANRALLRATRSQPRLEPVPVLNPRLANWRDELARCADDGRVRAVRLLPAYHDYGIGARAMDAVIEALGERRLRAVVQVRLIDERHEYHALRIRPVPTRELAKLLGRHATTPVLASGLLRSEIRALLPSHPALLADLALAEWFDTLGSFGTRVPPDRLVFATHTPFLVTAAARAKVAGPADPPPSAALAGGTLERFLSLQRPSPFSTDGDDGDTHGRRRDRLVPSRPRRGHLHGGEVQTEGDRVAGPAGAGIPRWRSPKAPRH